MDAIEFLLDMKTADRIRIEELISYLDVLIPVFVNQEGSTQKRRGERAIRYYISQGLVDKPSSHEGRWANFSYRHVLQILVVKSLQAQNLSLTEISERIAGLADEELEEILFARTKRGTESSQLSPAASPSRASGDVWRRFRIHDKIELHVQGEPIFLPDNLDLKATIDAVVNILTGDSLSNYINSDTWNRELELVLDPRSLGYDSPATSLTNLDEAVIALVTEGGLVPVGNPDGLESIRSTRFLKYSLDGINDLQARAFESIDRGWDNTYVNGDPDRLLPVDVMRELEAQGVFSRLHEYFFTTTGVAMSIDVARRVGSDIARELKDQGVSGVILTST